MVRLFFILAGISGWLAVMLGAFGAHALKSRLEPRLLEAYETGVRYQFYHTLALIALAVLLSRPGAPAALTVAGWCFIGGMTLFSGSLYLLATCGWKWLGPVTPLGGLVLIVGWACFTYGVWRMPSGG